MSLIAPLGGALVEQTLAAAELSDLQRRSNVTSLTLDPRHVADVHLLGSGAYSPLRGFLCSAEHTSVVEQAQLSDGTPWTLPITLPVSRAVAGSLRQGQRVLLRDQQGVACGAILVRDVFSRDSAREAREVYRTEDVAHPGVAALRAEGDLLLGGDVHAVAERDDPLPSTPAAARAEFGRRGWSRVVGFQTRNPVHRAHEHLTKMALEQVDGLFLHPLSGETSTDDVPFAVRLECYRVLLDRYYPQQRVLLGLFPAAMRYAGPREAVFHGLVRRNFGCSHFIIGRDAAGTGAFYGAHDAQRLYEELGGAARLGFTAMMFENAFWCRACVSMASGRTCPHGDEHHLVLSGTRVRELLRAGAALPAEFTRPEVAEILRRHYAAAALAGRA